MNTPFWLNDPKILLNKQQLYEIWPIQEMSTEEKLNAITRLIIILTILGYFISKTLKIVVTGLITIGILIFLFKIQDKRRMKKNLDKKEGFTNPEVYKALKKNFTEPKPNNPTMNVLLPEIQYDPDRKPAAPAYNKAVEKEINDSTKKLVEEKFCDPNIDERLFKDLGDNFTFDQSMRNWYSTPNTQIPNDQQSFAEFCYGDMISCKEGNELACTRNNPRWTNY